MVDPVRILGSSGSAVGGERRAGRGARGRNATAAPSRSRSPDTKRWGFCVEGRCHGRARVFCRAVIEGSEEIERRPRWGCRLARVSVGSGEQGGCVRRT